MDAEQDHLEGDVHHCRIDAYFDGELSANEREDVDRHLRGCAACARRLSDLGRLSAALRAAAEPESDAAIERLVRAARAARPARAAREAAVVAALPLIRGLTAAAAIVLAVASVALLVVVRHSPSPGPSTPLGAR